MAGNNLRLDSDRLAAVIARTVNTAIAAERQRTDAERQRTDVRFQAIETELAELKQRGYKGVWQPGESYMKGNEVTRSGSRWLSLLNHNSAVPGSNPHCWMLTVKRGEG